MRVEDTGFFQGFARLCDDGFAQGWHEANGGNLSYHMTDADVEACRDVLVDDDAAPAWRDLGATAPELAGAHILLTGSGVYLRNVSSRPAQSAGIVELNDAGDAWRLVWGLEDGGRPTSELFTHVMGLRARMASAAEAGVPGQADRVVYHAHCPNVNALSSLVEPDSRAWSRLLWKSMTECIIVFPQGLGVMPWMVPGSRELAEASADWMRTCHACIWTLHGVFASGRTFDEAFGTVHTIEKAVGSYLAARAANGGAEPTGLVTDSQLRAICARYDIVANESYLEA